MRKNEKRVKKNNFPKFVTAGGIMSHLMSAFSVHDLIGAIFQDLDLFKCG